MSEPLNQHDRDSRELRELCAQRDSARATVRQQSERIAELEAERDEHQATATALIALLADIRKACGDNGKRMQPELVEFIGAMSTERDRLREEVERLRPNAERYEWLRDCHPADESLWVAMGRPHAPGGVSCWRGDELDTAIDAARTHKETE